MVSMIERYGIYWAALDPVRGGELAKTRPVVIISDDAMNRLLDTVVVCPLSSRLHPRWPSRIQVLVGGKEAEIAVDQIRTVSKSRLGDRLDGIAPSVAALLRHLITEMYGLLAVSE
jgi:mRNA interferase MazF